MKLEDIHPNPKNPRFLRKEKSEWLEDSLNEFGDLSGYVFNKGGMIISAHQRWEKIKPKVKEVVVRETFKKPLPDGTIERGHFELRDGTKHDYSVRDWPQEKADRATIRANAQNAGEWDADVLSTWEYEVEELRDMGVPEWVFGGAALSDEEMDRFFQQQPPNGSDLSKKVLSLEYTEEDYAAVKDGLLKIAKTPEQAVWQLLKL